MNKLNGYYKINDSYGGGFKKVNMYNPTTGDTKTIITDDTEYQYHEGMTSREYDGETLENLWMMPIDEEVKKLYNAANNIPYIGAQIEVIKGRKYDHGSKGTIINLYEYKDQYHRYIATYAITDNGMKIDTKNIKVIA